MEQSMNASVHILLEKKAGEEEFRTELRAENDWMLLQGLALLTINCAKTLGYSVDEMVTRLAVVLLAPPNETGGT